MKGLMRTNIVEALVGVAVVALSVWFVLFAWNRTGGGGAPSALRVTALFPNASGVNVGTDVRIAGLKVGSVSAQRLDPKTWQAEVTLALDPATHVPADSTAAITSEGLLGATYVALMPGADSAALKNGDVIIDTQGSLDLMGLIGQFVNRSAAAGEGGAAAGGATEPAATPGQ